jgi:hypothetical protein
MRGEIGRRHDEQDMHLCEVVDCRVECFSMLRVC